VIRRSLRIGFRIGLLAGLGFALFKLVQSRRSPSTMSSGDEWPPAPKRTETPLIEPKMLHDVVLKKDGEVPSAGRDAVPSGSSASPATRTAKKAAVAPPAKRASTAAKKQAAPKSPGKMWVEPKGSFCPSSHPVKGKLSSGIYHLPGMAAYERTNPDRCYKDGDSAETDGLRRAKR
jgi:hypothetical protein